MKPSLPGMRRQRLAAGVSLAYLARELGITVQGIQSWEAGRTRPTADRVPEIAEALGCSIEDLYTEIINQEETESHDLQ